MDRLPPAAMESTEVSQRAQLAGTRMSSPVPAVRALGRKEMQPSVQVRTASISPERDVHLWRHILMPIVATRFACALDA